MSTYFSLFQNIRYSNAAAVDITERVVVANSSLMNPTTFYPMSLVAGTRADTVAYSVYSDPFSSWVLYLFNGVLDPYYDWYLSSEQFNAYVTDLYGSVQTSMGKVRGYVNGWVDQPTISVSAFEALDEDRKPYWEPVYNGSYSALSYVRRQEDWSASTNWILRLDLLPEVCNVTYSTASGIILSNDVLTQSDTRISGQIRYSNSSFISAKMTGNSEFSKFYPLLGSLSSATLLAPKVSVIAGSNVVSSVQLFSNASIANASFWSDFNVIMTANSGTAPDGMNSATLVSDGTSLQVHITYHLFTISGGVEYVFSSYFKHDTQRYVELIFDNRAGNGFGATFDLLSGTVTASGTSGNGVVKSASVTNVGSSWLLCSVRGNLANSDTSGRSSIVFATSPSFAWYPSYTGANNLLYAWNPTLQQSLSGLIAANSFVRIGDDPTYGTRCVSTSDATTVTLDYPLGSNASSANLYSVSDAIQPESTSLLVRTPAFDSDELVYVHYVTDEAGAPLTTGQGQVLSSNGTSVTIQHVSGNVFPYPDNPNSSVLIDANSYVYGTESRSNCMVSGYSILANVIPATTYDYWTPVYAYDLESANNDSHRTIDILKPELLAPFTTAVSTLLSSN